MRKIEGDLCHTNISKNLKPILSFDENRDFNEWKKQIREKFLELTGVKRVEENAVPLKVEIEEEVQCEGYKRIRFVFESEKDAFVPCYLLIPDTKKEKYPVAITLQGHSSGFHNSVGIIKEESDAEYASDRGRFAVQAVEQGFIGLAIEQRAMGERATTRHTFGGMMCTFQAMTAIMLGRTVLAERMFDVSRAIDALKEFPQCDLDNIIITGNSGGGTMSYYATCYDERIKATVPSCAFCPYENSIMDIYHCACNYIPSANLWFEMQDLSCLIAPRMLHLVSGTQDTIFPFTGVEKGFETVKKIYEKAGAKDNCALYPTPKGHWWCKDIVWGAVKQTGVK